MQLRLSIITSSLLATASLMAEDYVSVQFMSYDEESGRTTISTPIIEINKEFGADYTLNTSFTHDTVSGASPTYYDSASGASAKIPDGATYQDDIKYGDIEYDDTRKAVSLALTKRFESRDELTVGGNYSTEYDYDSKEVSAEYLHYLDSSKNQSITIGGSYQQNDVSIYCKLNTEACDSSSGASEKIEDLEVISTEIGFTQILDKTSLVKTSLFYISEDGYLSNPYMRVVRDYNSNPKITPENKPDSRKAYGGLIDYTKAINDKLATNLSYRFYNDDWDITSHTLDTALSYEFTDKFMLGLGLRYYTQSEAEFYNGKKDYFTNQKYTSSDRRMSSFDSINYKISGEYKINRDISVNANINYYKQDEFDATYWGIGGKYRF
jgi:hypothetical protein